MYNDPKTAAKFQGSMCLFEVKVGVHQGAFLDRCCLSMYWKLYQEDFGSGLPLKLMYADDLALKAESKEELPEKFHIWKTGLEAKGLKVNINKTKILHCMGNIKVIGDSGKYPCGVCRTGVGSKSIFCHSCGKLIHRRCSGVRAAARRWYASGDCR